METFKIPGLETKTEREEELGLQFEKCEYTPDKVFVQKKETTISEEKLKEMKKMSPILGRKANLFARIRNFNQ